MIRETPMSKLNIEDLFTDDYETKIERSSIGINIKVTRFRDGSAIHHFGGPVGDVRTDQYGNEV